MSTTPKYYSMHGYDDFAKEIDRVLNGEWQMPIWDVPIRNLARVIKGAIEYPHNDMIISRTVILNGSDVRIVIVIILRDTNDEILAITRQ